MTPQQEELFTQKVGKLAEQTGLTEASVSESIMNQLELMTSEWDLASTGRTLREVLEASRQDRKEVALRIAELSLKTAELRPRLEKSNDIMFSLVVALRERLGIAIPHVEMLTDAALVEMGLGYIDSVGRIVPGKRQSRTRDSQTEQRTGMITGSGSTPIEPWRSKYSVIPERARPTLDVLAIAAHAQEVGRRLWGEHYCVTVESLSEVNPNINTADCDAVNSIFSKPKYKTQRRVWEAFLNRLRRLALLGDDQEERVLVS
jgi:hypothetical protein